VPIIGRHVAFISPWGAFVVLSCVVAGIMLQVATSTTYIAPNSVPVAASADLMTRYLLAPPAEATLAGLDVSPIQRAAFFVALIAVSLTFAARLVNAEGYAKQMSVFLYLFIAILLAALSMLIGGLVT